jgi:hypothetical protein
MAEEGRTDVELINTLVELALLREFNQLKEIISQNEELLGVKVNVYFTRIKKTGHSFKF